MYVYVYVYVYVLWVKILWLDLTFVLTPPQFLFFWCHVQIEPYHVQIEPFHVQIEPYHVQIEPYLDLLDLKCFPLFILLELWSKYTQKKEHDSKVDNEEEKVDERETILERLAEHGLARKSFHSTPTKVLDELLQNKVDSTIRLARAEKDYPRTRYKTFIDFAEFSMMPSVVYDWKIPRCTTIRWW